MPGFPRSAVISVQYRTSVDASWVLNYFPKFLLDMPDTWLAMSNDPLARSLTPGWKGRVNEFTWFWSLVMFMEG